jgi:hypothetical protein|nr:hypothetical protein [Moraxellaceae bacterium]MBK7299968.1 hypothetical protein [Moraxellaceae bacterium]MBK8325801.1 hypothetical protein [Moraxellaceae bacterium]MBK9186248.1 hypothetical protein [Moraxellaceae bacterium]MBL0229534.1 hypothetical protein [Moraxellaceae bacterium]
MTSLTINVPDELAHKAKQAGLLQGDLLSHYICQFLEEKIQQQVNITDISAFAGLIKAKSTGFKRNLADFDAANFVESSNESH